MTTLHCLLAKSDNRIRGQFECDMIWFYFDFDFVPSHVRCGCRSIVCWRLRWVRLNLDVYGQEVGKMLDVDGQGVLGDLKI